MIFDPRWRCRHGFHDWTRIPDDVRALTHVAGLDRDPDWYVGPLLSVAECRRCGQRRKGSPDV